MQALEGSPYSRKRRRLTSATGGALTGEVKEEQENGATGPCGATQPLAVDSRADGEQREAQPGSGDAAFAAAHPAPGALTANAASRDLAATRTLQAKSLQHLRSGKTVRMTLATHDALFPSSSLSDRKLVTAVTVEVDGVMQIEELQEQVFVSPHVSKGRTVGFYISGFKHECSGHYLRGWRSDPGGRLVAIITSNPRAVPAEFPAPGCTPVAFQIRAIASRKDSALQPIIGWPLRMPFTAHDALFPGVPRTTGKRVTASVLEVDGQLQDRQAWDSVCVKPCSDLRGIRSLRVIGLRRPGRGLYLRGWCSDADGRLVVVASTDAEATLAPLPQPGGTPVAFTPLHEDAAGGSSANGCSFGGEPASDQDFPQPATAPTVAAPMVADMGHTVPGSSGACSAGTWQHRLVKQEPADSALATGQAGFRNRLVSAPEETLLSASAEASGGLRSGPREPTGHTSQRQGSSAEQQLRNGSVTGAPAAGHATSHVPGAAAHPARTVAGGIAASGGTRQIPANPSGLPPLAPRSAWVLTPHGLRPRDSVAGSGQQSGGSAGPRQLPSGQSQGQAMTSETVRQQQRLHQDTETGGARAPLAGSFCSLPSSSGVATASNGGVTCGVPLEGVHAVTRPDTASQPQCPSTGAGERREAGRGHGEGLQAPRTSGPAAAPTPGVLRESLPPDLHPPSVHGPDLNAAAAAAAISPAQTFSQRGVCLPSVQQLAEWFPRQAVGPQLDGRELAVTLRFEDGAGPVGEGPHMVRLRFKGRKEGGSRVSLKLPRALRAPLLGWRLLDVSGGPGHPGGLVMQLAAPEGRGAEGQVTEPAGGEHAAPAQRQHAPVLDQLDAQGRTTQQEQPGKKHKHKGKHKPRQGEEAGPAGPPRKGPASTDAAEPEDACGEHRDGAQAKRKKRRKAKNTSDSGAHPEGLAVPPSVPAGQGTEPRQGSEPTRGEHEGPAELHQAPDPEQLEAEARASPQQEPERKLRKDKSRKHKSRQGEDAGPAEGDRTGPAAMDTAGLEGACGEHDDGAHVKQKRRRKEKSISGGPAHCGGLAGQPAAQPEQGDEEGQGTEPAGGEHAAPAQHQHAHGLDQPDVSGRTAALQQPRKDKGKHKSLQGQVAGPAEGPQTGPTAEPEGACGDHEEEAQAKRKKRRKDKIRRSSQGGIADCQEKPTRTKHGAVEPVAAPCSPAEQTADSPAEKASKGRSGKRRKKDSAADTMAGRTSATSRDHLGGGENAFAAAMTDTTACVPLREPAEGVEPSGAARGAAPGHQGGKSGPGEPIAAPRNPPSLRDLLDELLELTTQLGEHMQEHRVYGGGGTDGGAAEGCDVGPLLALVETMSNIQLALAEGSGTPDGPIQRKRKLALAEGSGTPDGPIQRKRKLAARSLIVWHSALLGRSKLAELCAGGRMLLGQAVAVLEALRANR